VGITGMQVKESWHKTVLLRIYPHIKRTLITVGSRTLLVIVHQSLSAAVHQQHIQQEIDVVSYFSPSCDDLSGAGGRHLLDNFMESSR